MLRTVLQALLSGTADGALVEKLEDAKKVVYFANGTEVDVLELRPVEAVRTPQGSGASSPPPSGSPAGRTGEDVL